MKTISFLFIAAVLAGAACRPAAPADSNLSANSAANRQNENAPANSSSGTLSNSAAPDNSTMNAEMLRQIEAQQAETADPRKAANRSGSANSNQPAPKNPAGPSQRQTW